MPAQEVSKTSDKILYKLKLTDFEFMKTIVANNEKIGNIPTQTSCTGVFNLETVQYIKKQISFFEIFADARSWQETLLPMLSNKEAIIFDRFYLHPCFAKLEKLSKFLGVSKSDTEEIIQKITYKIVKGDIKILNRFQRKVQKAILVNLSKAQTEEEKQKLKYKFNLVKHVMPTLKEKEQKFFYYIFIKDEKVQTAAEKLLITNGQATKKYYEFNSKVNYFKFKNKEQSKNKE